MEAQPGLTRVESVVEDFNFPLAICWCSATTLAAGSHRVVEVFQRPLQFFSASVSSLQTSLVPLGRHRSCIGERGRRFQNLNRERRENKSC